MHPNKHEPASNPDRPPASQELPETRKTAIPMQSRELLEHNLNAKPAHADLPQVNRLASNTVQPALHRAHPGPAPEDVSTSMPVGWLQL